jgi:hypothetical protein
MFLNFVNNTLIQSACNDDAQTLCGSKTTLSDIYNCLTENEEKLSQQCLSNLQNKKKENPYSEAQSKMKHVTRTVTVVSIVYLCIPLCIGKQCIDWI